MEYINKYNNTSFICIKVKNLSNEKKTVKILNCLDLFEKRDETILIENTLHGLSYTGLLMQILGLISDMYVSKITIHLIKSDSLNSDELIVEQLNSTIFLKHQNIFGDTDVRPIVMELVASKEEIEEKYPQYYRIRENAPIAFKLDNKTFLEYDISGKTEMQFIFTAA